MENNDEMADINIDAKGVVLPQKSDKIALIDADTVIFASCSVLAWTEELLPESMYTKEEWEEILKSPGYIEELQVVDSINMEEAFIHSMEKLDFILERTGCKDFELHFTIGRKSFPYTMVSKDYKGNRTILDINDRAPFGIYALKQMFKEKFPDKVTMNTEWEADHIVVCKKRDNYDKYVLCAVDKDVLKALPGKMFNYYQSIKYNIDMKWVENTEDEAMRRYYIQTLMGDDGDNVIGIKGIGPKKAEKALKSCSNTEECWEAVVDVYEQHGRGIVDAITNMRLVDMRQLELVDGKYEVRLWKP